MREERDVRELLICIKCHEISAGPPEWGTSGSPDCFAWNLCENILHEAGIQRPVFDGAARNEVESTQKSQSYNRSSWIALHRAAPDS